MRPIKLLLTAFGPYKDKEEIDFTELGEHNLFVISGKTGSGKTTIFDGISFALYGSASGEDRDSVLMLRSQFSDDDVHTAVEFVFELKNRKYRVLRQIGHVKQGNKTKTGEKYEFYEQTEEGEVPRVDRQIVSEVNKKIEELIGLTQEQFKQIVMLPQGEFRKFLTSETENKEAILRRLFKTEPYQKIEEKLKEKQAQLKEVFNSDAQQLDSLTKNIIATIPEREKSDLLQLLHEDAYNTHQVLNGLVDENKYYTHKIEQDEKHYQAAEKNYVNEFKKLSEARVTNEQFSKRTLKLKEKTDLDEKEAEHIKNESSLIRAERANQIIPYEKQLLEAEKDLASKRASLIETKKLNEENKVKLTKAKSLYESAKETVHEREKFKINIDALNRYIPIVKEITELKVKIERKEKAVLDSTKQLDNLKKSHQENEQSLNTMIKKIEEITDLVQVLPKKQQEKKDLQTDWKKLHEYENVLTKLKSVEEEYVENQKIYERTYHKYDLAEQSWLNNEAAFLATHLHDGKACQVCGSLTHPNKAGYEEDVLTKSELEVLKKLREEEQSIVQKLEHQINGNKEALNESKKELTELGYNVDEIKEEKNLIEIIGKQLASEITDLETKQKNQKELVIKREGLREEINKEKAEIESIDQKAASDRIQFAENKASYTTKLATIPEEYQKLEVIESEQEKLIKLNKKLESEWTEAEKNLKETENAHLTSMTNLTQLTNQVVDIRTRYSKANKSFKQVLTDSEFTTIETYQAAKLAPERQKELKLTVDNYNQTYTQVSHELNQLNEALKGKEVVDLDVLENKVNELKEVSKESYDILQLSKRALKDIENLLKHIKEVRESLQKNEEALSVLTDLYDVTRGHNTQKISFERFLQIEYLEQIIHAANVRLIELSNGQFNLILSERQETHGRQSGLALDVNDAYTGQTRDVKTLSGGEKFNASLALALGMSDVIQSFEGNISIDMMFIDEGFGSLDEESLTKSIDALIDLQKSGRLIGVISHVEELKAVFPAILEVTKTKEGYSKTEFKIK